MQRWAGRQVLRARDVITGTKEEGASGESGRGEEGTGKRKPENRGERKRKRGARGGLERTALKQKKKRRCCREGEKHSAGHEKDRVQK